MSDAVLLQSEAMEGTLQIAHENTVCNFVGRKCIALRHHVNVRVVTKQPPIFMNSELHDFVL